MFYNETTKTQLEFDLDLMKELSNSNAYVILNDETSIMIVEKLLEYAVVSGKYDTKILELKELFEDLIPNNNISTQVVDTDEGPAILIDDVIDESSFFC